MSRQNLSRRDLLKLLAAATGAAALSTVPNEWVTPLVEIGALPAHAQGSQLGAIQVGISQDSDAKPRTQNPAVPCTFAVVTVPSLSLSHCYNSPGTFTFTNIPTGNYTVRCEIMGCGFLPDKTANVVAPSTATITFNFTLCN